MGSRFLTTLNNYFHRRTPGYLIFFVTPFCNCRCAMCFNRQVIDNAARRNPLRLDEIERVARHFHHLHHVNFSGGEPFLRQDFREIPGLFYRHSGTRFFACPTNSSQPEKIEAAVRHICRSCPDAWVRITQSMDGIGEDHNAIRGKAGLFEQVLELNRRLELLQQKEANLSVGIAMVMSQLNRGKEYEILDYACARMSFSDFGVLYVRGDTYDPEAKKVDAADYVRFVEACRERLRPRAAGKSFSSRLFSAITATATDLLADSIVHDRYVTPCRAGRNMLVMDDEGTVRPCEMLEYLIETGRATLDSAILGNVRDVDYDIKRLIDTAKARDMRRYIREKKCYCSFECAMSVNVLYSPSLWPKMLRRFLNY
jgi:MoaA/NifB/PqqE/SkfB family radical SAM enzyme